MKFKGTKLSKRTAALFAAALVLLGSGGAMGTRAVPTILGSTFDTQIETPILSVALTENGSKVADGGALFKSIGDKVEPGKAYTDPISVMNDGNTDEYVRVVVRKYWTKPEKKDGKNVDTGVKDTSLTPDQIVLAQASGWTVKDGESPETKVYYFAKPVAAGDTVKLFDSVKVASSVATDPEIDKADVDIEGREEKVTIVTYKYAYDGYTFHVEAEAQSVQTHNAAQAIKSVWGVDASTVGINL